MIQDARVVWQSASPSLRDKSMADNVDWILEHIGPGAKIVLWAHNFHVSRSPGWMGDYLDRGHGNDMAVFGFSFHEGRYTAIGPRGLTSYSTSVSDAGSIEWAFHRTGFPRLMLDLRLASGSDSNSSWLKEPLDLRNIGAVAVNDAFRQTNVADYYDIMIFFDQTTPSVLLQGGQALDSSARRVRFVEPTNKF